MGLFKLTLIRPILMQDSFFFFFFIEIGANESHGLDLIGPIRVDFYHHLLL